MSEETEDRDPAATPRESWRLLGADRVIERDDSLLVHSRADMDGWEVRNHRKPIVHYGGRTWTIVGKRRGDAGGYRYELIPWTPAELDEPGVEILYDEAFVAQRDRDRVVGRRREVQSVALTILTPLIGFLGGKTKRRLEASHGVDPVRASYGSIYIEGAIILVCLVLVSIGAMVEALGGPSPWNSGRLAWIALILGVDVLVRYGRLLSEQRYGPGFYEWIWYRRSR